MADSTVAEQSMDSSLQLNSMSNNNNSDPTSSTVQPTSSSSPRDIVKSEDVEMSTVSAPQQQHLHSSPLSLKGNKNTNIMLGATPIPSQQQAHHLSMNPENNSLHHFQTDTNCHPLYSTSSSTATHIDPTLTTPQHHQYQHSPNGNTHGVGNSAFVQATLGPLSIPTSPSSFSSASLVPSSTTAAFMAMHGHNTSLMMDHMMLPNHRRNSVPTLTADMAEHRRKISAEEKTLHRQASWSNLSSNSMMLGSSGGYPSGTLSGFPDSITAPSSTASTTTATTSATATTHVDPTMMQFYRASSLGQQQQSQHGFHHQMLPSTTNSSACPSPMPESFMPGTALNTISSTSSSSLGLLSSFQNNSLDEDNNKNNNEDDDRLPHHQGVKIKRNNSVCSTTSMSSTGSTGSNSGNSNNKHLCKFPACGWSFKRYEHLKRHMLVHSKERPFVCGVQGCDKSFSRSDNFSAHLRTHSKKGSIHDDDGTMNEDGSESSVKQENSSDPLQGITATGSYVADGSDEYNRRDYSPPSSPFGEPSSMHGGDESYTMMSQNTGYPFSAGSTMYPLDPLENLSSMVPRFEPIRLDLKSVAPGDIHKQPYEDGTVNAAMLHPGGHGPDGESPHPTPMEHYEHFGFPSSISTHFMPMLHGGFSGLDQAGLHHHHQPQHHGHHHAHHHQLHHQPSLESTTSSYSSLPSADSSSSVSSFNQHGYHQDYHGFQFSNGMDTSSSPSSAADLHYSQQQHQQMVASPMTSVDPHHQQQQHPHPLSQQHHAHLHHPHPHHAHILQHHPHHHQQNHHHGGFPPMLHHSSPNSALPPHPLMSSTSPFSTPGLNEPLYSSSSASSSSTSLTGPRGTSSPSNVNGSPTSSTATATPANSTGSAGTGATATAVSTTTGSTTSGTGSSGGSSKHGGSGKHHTCNVIGCSKRFKRLEHLKRHIKTHTLERPFNCPYSTCTKKFSRSDNLSQHVKTHQRQMTKLQMKQRNQAQAQAQQQHQQQQQQVQQLAVLSSMGGNGSHRMMVEM
ncbi:hypothetical protein BGZ83_011565 [Gryganskiella cystojenkinii]|nr:hypothetical protein BGZ83_011565 [Gryganskiella cystojenkinii]